MEDLGEKDDLEVDFLRFVEEGRISLVDGDAVEVPNDSRVVKHGVRWVATCSEVGGWVFVWDPRRRRLVAAGLDVVRNEAIRFSDAATVAKNPRPALVAAGERRVLEILGMELGYLHCGSRSLIMTGKAVDTGDRGLGVARIYDIPQLMDSLEVRKLAIQPRASQSFPGRVPVQALFIPPLSGISDQDRMFLLRFDEGSVNLVDSQNLESTPIRDHSRDGATAMAVSTRGRLCIGTAFGHLELFRLESQNIVRSDPFVPTVPVIESGWRVSQVCWLSEEELLAIYSNEDMLTRHFVYEVRDSFKLVAALGEIFFNVPDEGQAPSIFSLPIPSWNAVVLGMSNSTDVELVTKDEKEGWVNVKPDEGCRAVLPNTGEDYRDTYPLGLALDLTNMAPVAARDPREEPRQPMPRVLAFTTDGILVPWAIVDDRPGAVCAAVKRPRPLTEALMDAPAMVVMSQRDITTVTSIESAFPNKMEDLAKSVAKSVALPAESEDDFDEEEENEEAHRDRPGTKTDGDGDVSQSVGQMSGAPAAFTFGKMNTLSASDDVQKSVSGYESSTLKDRVPTFGASSSEVLDRKAALPHVATSGRPPTLDARQIIEQRRATGVTYDTSEERDTDAEDETDDDSYETGATEELDEDDEGSHLESESADESLSETSPGLQRASDVPFAVGGSQVQASQDQTPSRGREPKDSNGKPDSHENFEVPPVDSDPLEGFVPLKREKPPQSVISSISSDLAPLVDEMEEELDRSFELLNGVARSLHRSQFLSPALAALSGDLVVLTSALTRLLQDSEENDKQALIAMEKLGDASDLLEQARYQWTSTSPMDADDTEWEDREREIGEKLRKRKELARSIESHIERLSRGASIKVQDKDQRFGDVQAIYSTIRTQELRLKTVLAMLKALEAEYDACIRSFRNESPRSPAKRLPRSRLWRLAVSTKRQEPTRNFRPNMRSPCSQGDSEALLDAVKRLAMSGGRDRIESPGVHAPEARTEENEPERSTEAKQPQEPEEKGLSRTHSTAQGGLAVGAWSSLLSSATRPAETLVSGQRIQDHQRESTKKKPVMKTTGGSLSRPNDPSDRLSRYTSASEKNTGRESSHASRRFVSPSPKTESPAIAPSSDAPRSGQGTPGKHSTKEAQSSAKITAGPEIGRMSPSSFLPPSGSERDVVKPLTVPSAKLSETSKAPVAITKAAGSIAALPPSGSERDAVKIEVPSLPKKESVKTQVKSSLPPAGSERDQVKREFPAFASSSSLITKPETVTTQVPMASAQSFGSGLFSSSALTVALAPLSPPEKAANAATGVATEPKFSFGSLTFGSQPSSSSTQGIATNVFGSQAAEPVSAVPTSAAASFGASQSSTTSLPLGFASSFVPSQSAAAGKPLTSGMSSSSGQSASLFGATASSFGGSGTSAFGSATGGVVFGTPSPGFGGQLQPSTFGTPSPLGSAPSGGAVAAFGTPSTLGGGGPSFGAPSPLGASGFGKPSAFGFSSASFGSTQPAKVPSFGASQGSAFPTSGFGGSGFSGSSFGGSSGSSFGGSSGQLGGGFGAVASQSGSGGFGQSASSGSPFGGGFGATSLAPSPGGFSGLAQSSSSFGGFNSSASPGVGFGGQPSGGGFGAPSGGFSTTGFGSQPSFGAQSGFGSPTGFGAGQSAFANQSPFSSNTQQNFASPAFTKGRF